MFRILVLKFHGAIIIIPKVNLVGWKTFLKQIFVQYLIITYILKFSLSRID